MIILGTGSAFIGGYGGGEDAVVGDASLPESPATPIGKVGACPLNCVCGGEVGWGMEEGGAAHARPLSRAAAGGHPDRRRAPALRRRLPSGASVVRPRLPCAGKTPRQPRGRLGSERRRSGRRRTGHRVSPRSSTVYRLCLRFQREKAAGLEKPRSKAISFIVAPARSRSRIRLARQALACSVME